MRVIIAALGTKSTTSEVMGQITPGGSHGSFSKVRPWSAGESRTETHHGFSDVDLIDHG